MDFALNQKTASRRSFAKFLDLAAELGCVGIEPRNALGRPLVDGMAPDRAAEMARERGLRFVGLSEVYPFTNWNAERHAAVAALIDAAEAAGAKTVSLIPRVDVRDPDPVERAAALCTVVAEIAPLLADTKVIALLEPIGFTTCSMRFQREAAAAIESLNLGDRFGIVHDTFQRAPVKDEDILMPHIRMVHISGVTDGSGDLTDAQDAERVLIDESDRTDALGQLRRWSRQATAGHSPSNVARLASVSARTLRGRSPGRSPTCGANLRRSPPECAGTRWGMAGCKKKEGRE